MLSTVVAALSSALKTRGALQLENLALRHQIGVLQRSAKKRPKLTAADRFFWAWLLCRLWGDWRSALVIVKPGLTDGSATELLEGDLKPGDQLITEVTGVTANRRRVGAF